MNNLADFKIATKMGSPYFLKTLKCSITEVTIFADLPPNLNSAMGSE